MARPRLLPKPVVDELKKILNVSIDNTVHERIRGEIGRHLPLELAASLYMAQNDLDPYNKKYKISQGTLDKLPQIGLHGISTPTTRIKSEEPISKIRRNKSITYIKIPPADPILPPSKIDEAIRMATKVYPYIYILENSIRELIIQVMNGVYPNQDWWNISGVIPRSVKEKVKIFIDSEKQSPWLGRRVSQVHQIYYSLLEHLSKIITHDTNWEPHFKEILGDKDFIVSITKRVKNIRNNIMHSNPISNRIINKAKQVLEEWQESEAVKQFGASISRTND